MSDTVEERSAEGQILDYETTLVLLDDVAWWADSVDSTEDCRVSPAKKTDCCLNTLQIPVSFLCKRKCSLFQKAELNELKYRSKIKVIKTIKIN